MDVHMGNDCMEKGFEKGWMENLDRNRSILAQKRPTEFTNLMRGLPTLPA